MKDDDRGLFPISWVVGRSVPDCQQALNSMPIMVIKLMIVYIAILCYAAMNTALPKQLTATDSYNA